jgi:hypothetical protein
MVKRASIGAGSGAIRLDLPLTSFASSSNASSNCSSNERKFVFDGAEMFSHIFPLPMNLIGSTLVLLSNAFGSGSLSIALRLAIDQSHRL